MTVPLVTLTTDFGQGSAYVAAMKGALLRLWPEAPILDLSHDLPPQDLLQTAWFLQDAIPWFPPGTLHLVVVDPGVGTERALLYIEIGDQALLAPDNGCWTTLGNPSRVIRLTENRFWHPRVSSTFHGRDILAPIAGHLCRGVDPACLGPVATTWTRIEVPQPRNERSCIRGQVILIDRFGNIISNVRTDRVWSAINLGTSTGARRIEFRVSTYGEAKPGEVVSLRGSNGQVEVAVVQGNAADLLRVRPGDSLTVVFPEEEP